MALITPWTDSNGNFVESLPLHVRGRVLCLLILFFAKSTKDHRKTLHWTDRLFLSLCHSWSSLFPMYLHDSDLRSSQSHVSYRLVKKSYLRRPTLNLWGVLFSRLDWIWWKFSLLISWFLACLVGETGLWCIPSCWVLGLVVSGNVGCCTKFYLIDLIIRRVKFRWLIW